MNNISSVSTDSDKKRTASAVVKGSIISIIISIMLFALLALAMLFGNLPDGFVGPIVIAVSLISIFIGSSMTAKGVGESGWLWGGICGFVYYIIVYISALSAIREFNFSIRTLIMVIVGIIAGMAGGIFGANSGGKKRRR